MLTGIMLIAALSAVYLACLHPAWFLSVFFFIPTILDGIANWTGADLTTASLGGVGLRTWDPGTLGLIVGTLYQGRLAGRGFLFRQRWGWAATVVVAFLLVKVLASILLGGRGSGGGVANSSFGGLLAAIGEVRDAFLALIVPFYVLASAKHLHLRMMIRPLMLCVLVLLAKGISEMVRTRQIWDVDAEHRFINANEAITLTTVGVVLIFLGVGAGLRSRLCRPIAVCGIALAVLANHRSQWLALGVGTITGVILALRGGARLWRTPWSRTIVMAFLLAGGTVPFILVHWDGHDGGGISRRMLAITDPSSDSTASWRQQLWADRVGQVGDDWPWGRQLGDRRATWINAAWSYAPNHNGYVTAYELGGVAFSILVGAFWLSLLREALFRLWAGGGRAGNQPDVGTASVAVVVIAMSLGFAVAYDFAPVGTAVAATLLLSHTNGSTSLVNRKNTGYAATAGVR